MARPTFKPLFEEKEGDIKTRVVGNIPDEWRKEPGDFIHDAVAATPLEIKQLQINQDYVLKNAFAQYAEGEYLDAKLAEIGLTRKKATFSKRLIQVTADAGVVVPRNYSLYVVVLDKDGNPLEFRTDGHTYFTETGNIEIAVTCTVEGPTGNVPNGSEFILQPPIPGIRGITDKGITIPGAAAENDQEAWDRYYYKVNNPDTGGNRHDYVRWTQEVTGVGKVKVLPLWAGNGTVKVVITDTEGEPGSPLLVEEVQEYLDPGASGLGDGKAPCGAQVTAVSAANLPVNIAANVTYNDNVDPAIARQRFSNEVRAYLKSIIFIDQAVAYVKIGALLINTEGVINYSDLTINGLGEDISPGPEEVATLGTVAI